MEMPYRQPTFAVAAITKDEFQRACGSAIPECNPIIEESGWFCDDTDSFLGVLLRDKTDDDWGYVLLARDAHFRFRAIKTEVSLATRDQARVELQMRIAGLLAKPQRIFPQGDEEPKASE